MKTNHVRIEFLRAFYRLKTPDVLDVTVFESLQKAFFNANGKLVYKDFAAFRASKAHYIRHKKEIVGGTTKIKKPSTDQKNITCPCCLAKLEFV